MSQNTGSREFRDRIVGKTISSVVAKPGRNGQPPIVLMMQFDDGSVVEFVSPRSDRLLRRSLHAMSSDGMENAESRSLELIQLPLDGLGASGLN